MYYFKSRKIDYRPPLECEGLLTTNNDLLPYGDVNERVYNHKLNKRKIHSLNCLDVETKQLLIENNIETVGELKFASLDFLLDFNQQNEADKIKFNAFLNCKKFLSECEFKKGKPYLDL